MFLLVSVIGAQLSLTVDQGYTIYGINTCLILQNMLDVTVTALAVQNKREYPNRVKGFVETVVPNYCDPTFASHFRMKRQTFQVKDNPLLTSETVL